MDNLLGILLGVFVLCILVASHFWRAALRSLGASHRSELVSISANASMLNLAVPIVVALAYTFMVLNKPETLPVATVGALGVMLVHSIASTVLAHRAYRSANMPPQFMRYFRLGRATRIFGAATLFTGIVLWLVYARPDFGHRWQQEDGESPHESSAEENHLDSTDAVP